MCVRRESRLCVGGWGGGGGLQDYLCEDGVDCVCVCVCVCVVDGVCACARACVCVRCPE